LKIYERNEYANDQIISK